VHWLPSFPAGTSCTEVLHPHGRNALTHAIMTPAAVCSEATDRKSLPLVQENFFKSSRRC
jgi:hypothetical protein